MDGVLSLLSKQQLVKGRRDLTMQTSSIQADVNMPNTVECSRMDILIAGLVSPFVIWYYEDTRYEIGLWGLGCM